MTEGQVILGNRDAGGAGCLVLVAGGCVEQVCFVRDQRFVSFVLLSK